MLETPPAILIELQTTPKGMLMSPDPLLSPAASLAYWARGGSELGVKPWLDRCDQRFLRTELELMDELFTLVAKLAAITDHAPSGAIYALSKAAGALNESFMSAAYHSMHFHWQQTISLAVGGVRNEGIRWQIVQARGRGWPHS